MRIHSPVLGLCTPAGISLDEVPFDARGDVRTLDLTTADAVISLANPGVYLATSPDADAESFIGLDTDTTSAPPASGAAPLEAIISLPVGGVVRFRIDAATDLHARTTGSNAALRITRLVAP